MEPKPSPKSPLSEKQINQARHEGARVDQHTKFLKALVENEARDRHETTGELPEEPDQTIVIHGDQPSWYSTIVPVYGHDERKMNLKSGLRRRGKDDQFTK